MFHFKGERFRATSDITVIKRDMKKVVKMFTENLFLTRSFLLDLVLNNDNNKHTDNNYFQTTIIGFW